MVIGYHQSLSFFGDGYFDCDKTTDKCVDKSAPDADIDTRYTRWPDAGILIFSYKPWFQQLLPRCQVSTKYWWLKYNIQMKFMEIQYFIHNEIHIYLKSGSCTFLRGCPALTRIKVLDIEMKFHNIFHNYSIGIYYTFGQAAAPR